MFDWKYLFCALILNNVKVLKWIVGFELHNTVSYIYKKFCYRISTFTVHLYIPVVLHLPIQRIFQECIPGTGRCDRFWGYRAWWGRCDWCAYVNLTFPSRTYLSHCHYLSTLIKWLKLEDKACTSIPKCGKA